MHTINSNTDLQIRDHTICHILLALLLMPCTKAIKYTDTLINMRSKARKAKQRKNKPVLRPIIIKNV